MLLFRKCRFLCVPKTASEFCTEALSRSCKTVQHSEKHHAGLGTKTGRNLPTFGVIRHPVTWYESYWRYRRMKGWKKAHNIDRECRSDDLETFITNVLDAHPGWLSHYYEIWFGEDLEQLPIVCRYENLLDDLCNTLTQLGEPFNRKKLRGTSNRNVGDRVKFPAPPLSEELQVRIIAAEHRIISKYYAEDTKRYKAPTGNTK